MMATAMYGEVPDGMRARVFGATTAGVAASMPLGALLGGLAVEQVGLAPTLATCAALYLVLGGSPLFIRGFAGLSAARDHGAADVEVEVETGAGMDLDPRVPAGEADVPEASSR